MSKKSWAKLFLGITGFAIILELIAAFDGSPNTTPWTEYIVTYVPFELFLLVLTGGTVWLGYHFISRYVKRRKL